MVTERPPPHRYHRPTVRRTAARAQATRSTRITRAHSQIRNAFERSHRKYIHIYEEQEKRRMIYIYTYRYIYKLISQLMKSRWVVEYYFRYDLPSNPLSIHPIHLHGVLMTGCYNKIIDSTRLLPSQCSYFDWCYLSGIEDTHCQSIPRQSTSKLISSQFVKIHTYLNEYY